MTPRMHAHWLDWLKVLAVLGVFYYHTAMIFGYADWVIHDRERSLVLSAIAGFGYAFGMPLFFLLSGAASWYALRRRTAAEFTWLRFKRLILPLAAGLALLSPLQAYLSASSRGSTTTLSEAYQLFYLRFFDGLSRPTGPRMLGTYGYHLWFLGFLFLYSVIGLPVMLWLRGPAGARLMSRLAAASERGPGLLWFVLPMVAVQAALRFRYPALLDWADFAYWFVYFVAGFVIAADPRFPAALARHWRPVLLLGVVLVAALIPVAASGAIIQLEGRPKLTPANVAYFLVRTMLTWSWVLAVLALGVTRLNFSNRLLEYASDAVLPFYVLHHPVVVLVGYEVIRLPWSLWPKHITVVVVSLLLTVTIYELGVRRFGPVRTLFGLRPRNLRRETAPSPLARPG